MKKTMLGFAMCALFLASCSEDQSVGVSPPSNPDAINFISSTTRAAVADLPALKASTAGFVVYASSPASSSAWFTGIDGTNNYKFSTPNWVWAGATPQWPLVAGNYPMNFYAYFAPSYTGFIPAITPATALKGEYTIQPESTQVDFLSAKEIAVSKPASGQLMLTFGHMLSKVNFMIVPGNGVDVHLQSLNINNVGNKRIYDFMTGSWGAQPTALTSGYIYKMLAKPATKITGTDVNELAAKNISPTTADLMLMPQTSAAWTPVSGTAPANAYMGFIYRLETANNVNAVGYKDASAHPNFSGLTPTEQTALSGKPLFVKAGYAFGPSPFTWAPGKAYTYNIQLGTAASMNGYLLDDKYYDENGNPVNLDVIGKDPGDPVSSGSISFLVNVTNWVDQAVEIK